MLDAALFSWGWGLAATTNIAAKDVAVAGVNILGDGEVYAGAVIRQDDDHLMASVWAPPDSGSQFTEKSHVAGTTVSDLAVCDVQLSNGNLAGAFSDKDTGKLKVVVWNVDYNGAVTRLAAQMADVAGQVSITRESQGKAVTAATNANHEVTVTMWDCVTKAGQAQQYDVKKIADNSAAAKVKANRVGVASWKKGVVTAIQDSDTGNLKLIAWEIKNDGTIVKTSEVGMNTQIDRLAICNTGDASGNRLATAIRKSDLTMQVQIWDLENDGSAFHLRDTDAPPDPAHVKELSLTSIGALYWANQKIAERPDRDGGDPQFGR